MTTDPLSRLGALVAVGLACSPGVEYHAPVDRLPLPTEPTGLRWASLTHALVPSTLPGDAEQIACYSWTLNNEAPLYVSAVEFANLGSFHHSNWFAVPDSVYEGPDGAWPCEARGFESIAAAQAGTILFAQSTQAWEERVAFAEGAVVRIAAHARIVGEVHLLNLAPAAREAAAWLTLELQHPYDVAQVLSPLQLSYLDLSIPAQSQARFTSECPPSPQPGGINAFGQFAGVEVHYVLPHFHAAANYFNFQFGPTRGFESLGPDGAAGVTIEGFNASSAGRVFNPPVILEFEGRVDFTCGYNNEYSVPLEWGIGIDEMCIVFALVAAPYIYNGVVLEDEGVVRQEDGVDVHEGTCIWSSTPKGLAYEMPTSAERAAPLYLPPGFGANAAPPAPPSCVDADPNAQAIVAGTLDNVRQYVFEPSCVFSSCHGVTAAAGLDLRVTDLSAALAEHVVVGPSSLPLIEPGNAEGSWLYQVMSRCEPGAGARPMPANSPVRLEDDIVAILRDWIEAGAPA